MNRATLLVIVAYASAFVVALIVGRTLEGFHPVLVALVADIAATVAIFSFSMAFDNSSFYDAYWSVAPPVIALYWCRHPAAIGALSLRQSLALLLITVWGVRLTYNWYRRWHGLDDEDWRYVDLRARSGQAWAAVNLAGIHLFPTLVVFAGLIPVYAAVTSPAPFGLLDVVALVVTASAIAIEAGADEQLRRFLDNRSDQQQILTSGLWGWCRHPNYLGENLFWWGLFLFGLAALPQWWWSMAGAAAITAMFVFISVPMLDQRSLSRRPGYDEQIKRLPALLPRLPY